MASWRQMLLEARHYLVLEENFQVLLIPHPGQVRRCYFTEPKCCDDGRGDIIKQGTTHTHTHTHLACSR